MDLLKLWLFFSFFVLFINLLNKLTIKIKINLKRDIEKNRLDYGLISRKDLARFNIDIFEDLCKDYLIFARRAEEFRILSEQCLGGVDMVFTEEDTPIYVRCILKEEVESKKPSPDTLESIGEEEVKTLLGRMVFDGVKEAIIITNSDFSVEATSFVEEIKNKGDYKIQLVDGYNFIEGIRELRENRFKEVVEYV